MHLSDTFRVLQTNSLVDLRDADSYPTSTLSTVPDGGFYDVHPGKMVLGATIEKVSFSRHHAGLISGLSGLARLGLSVQLSTLVSPGFGETAPASLTLEIYNLLDVPIRIYPGMRICHLCFFQLKEEAGHSYDKDIGTYSNQIGPEASKFYRDFRDYLE